jgi:Tfp pilus assembly protein PilF
MEVAQFARRLLLDDDKHDKRFALFLGAGCSVTSGIPAAGALVRDRWLPRLCDINSPGERDIEGWAVRTIPGYKPEDPSASYGGLINELFLTPDDRQREIESLCDGRSPSFGYAVLAQLVARPGGRFNVVLTTNFDDLVADALYLYTDSRPLVIHHESLASFIRPTRTRPLVVKLHGDHRLAPRNTVLETESVEAEVARHTAMVLNDRGLVFMGYGGNDKGILKLLSELPREALPLGAYWVHPQKPTGPIRDWLSQRNGIWIKSGWFDEVMLVIRNTFNLPHPDPQRFTRVFTDYQKAFEQLSTAIEAKPANDASAAPLKEAVRATERSFPDFWQAISEALRLDKSDSAEAEKVYQAAIEQFPSTAPLLGNYALFLERTPGRREEAEAFYKRAIEANPKHAINLGNYADFLEQTSGRREEAEPFFKRAIEADPKQGYVIGTYAGFLARTPGRRGEAEAFYRRAIEADPKQAFIVGNYARFLEQTPRRREEAEAFYKRAIEANPKYAYVLGNYALFLNETPGRREEAEAFYKRAITADPKYAYVLGNYALFLNETPGRREEAEAFYKRAIEADPKYAYVLGNYALFLQETPGRRDEAEAFYKRAIEADPKHLFSLRRYADWLEEVRGDKAAAEDLRKRAKELSSEVD